MADDNQQTQTNNHDQAQAASVFIDAIAKLRGILVDKLNDLNAGTTGGGMLGKLGDLIGIADSIDKYMESQVGWATCLPTCSNLLKLTKRVGREPAHPT